MRSFLKDYGHALAQLGLAAGLAGATAYMQGGKSAAIVAVLGLLNTAITQAAKNSDPPQA